MKLIEINDTHFNKMLSNNADGGGNQINESLLKLFDNMNNHENINEVSIKVAALNQLYSTAIQYIKPVVDKIVYATPINHNYTLEEYIELVDKIATVGWTSKTTGKEHIRCNLSFASKYVHFLSQYKTPIYDSYIWIIMIGYLKQHGIRNYSFTALKSYTYFYEVFSVFKKQFNLESKTNYNIDKFLWQYGKELLTEIMENKKLKLNKAKTVLKHEISLSLR